MATQGESRSRTDTYRRVLHFIDVGVSAVVAPTVIVVPLSGYINRLQAMASGAILADRLGSEWRVVWRPSSVAPAASSDIFDSSLTSRHFLSSQEALEMWGVSVDDVPLYLTENRNNEVLYLRGHDKGEQVFMNDLQTRLSEGNSLNCLVIVAGGKFDLLGSERSVDAISRRFEFYRALAFAPEIENRVAALVAGRQPYLGLHLRFTDRSLQSPSQRATMAAVNRLSELESASSVFVAADSPETRDEWIRRLQSAGLEPWSQDLHSIDRTSQSAAVDALSDWRILARARALVYFQESSFGEEAAVASGAFDASIGLRASSARLLSNWTRYHLRNLATYPKRHWST